MTYVVDLKKRTGIGWYWYPIVQQSPDVPLLESSSFPGSTYFGLSKISFSVIPMVNPPYLDPPSTSKNGIIRWNSQYDVGLPIFVGTWAVYFFFTSHPIERKSGTLPTRALAAAVLQQQETLHSPEPSSTVGDMKRLWIATVPTKAKHNRWK